MFIVFSQGLNKIISADNVQNYKNVFLCPNPTCSAKLTLRAVNSSIVSPHFTLPAYAFVTCNSAQV